MRMRTRKFIGTVATISFVIVYALCAMALAQVRPLQESSAPVQVFFFAVLGLAWILPLMPLIRWMQRPDA
jgi:hypothetical protein